VLEGRCLLSTYTLTDLGSLGGGSGAAYGINDAGQVVGYATTANARGHAFLWDGGVLTDLGTLGGLGSVANAVNQKGQVVGFSDTGTVPVRAFLWQDGVLTDLAPGSRYSFASGINDAGQVVGFSEPPPGSGPGGAFLWQDGVLTDLGTLPGGLGSEAFHINDAGQVVGDSGVSVGTDLVLHAFLWQDGVMTDLGTPPGDRESVASGINSAGQVVGASGDLSNDDPSLHAAVWQDGTWNVVGPLGSGATAINDSGQVVGFMPGSGDFARNHAFLYADGVLTDLNSLIPPGSGLTLFTASAINNAGQIVGLAYGTGGGIIPHAYLLTPDAGGALRGVDPGVLRLPAPVHEAAAVGASTGQPPASALREQAPAESMTPLPAGAAVRPATDAIFASSHQGHTPAPEGGWEVEGLGLGVFLVPPV
jgi:probable HAF family extracellular repeat protein